MTGRSGLWRAISGRLRGHDLALQLTRLIGQFGVAGLHQEGVKTAMLLDRPHGAGRQPKADTAAENLALHRRVLKVRKKRRRVLLFAWLTLLPDITVLPVI